MIRNKSSIKKLAEGISLEYKEKITPLNKILIDEGISVFYDSYGKDTFDGMTIYENGQFFIHLNTDLGNRPDSERGRFTLAHELGHYYIDSHRIGLIKGLLEPHSSKTNQKQFSQIEREADFFASCLLMPEERFAQDFYRKKFSVELIDFLKDEYGVSRTACAFRFADIGNHDIMIVYGENRNVIWNYCSENFPYKYLINKKNIPQNTVMGEYLILGDNSNTYCNEQVWAVDWFNYVSKNDISRSFFEYCYSFKNKALSLIWES